MGAVKLEVRCPQNVHGITIDPEPNWNFNSLLSELDSLENRLPRPFTKTKSREFYNERRVESRSASGGFVMRLSDGDGVDDIEEEEEVHDRRLVEAKRFTCDQLFLSDSDESDNESALEVQPYLMDGMGLVEGALFELTHEHQLGLKEEIRNRVSALEMDLMSENDKSTSALLRVQKYREVRRDMDKKLDTQYQRKIAEALDNHLTAVQRDHELRSQIEERRIRSDAAYEEAKRKEKALQEEKLRQEKARTEAEAKLRAEEEAKRAALEAERKAAEERAEKEAAESSKRNPAGVSQEEATGHPRDANSGISNAQSKGSGSNGRKDSQSAAGNILRAAESAINLEQGRLQKLKEIDEKNQSLRLSSNQDFSSYERHIARLIRQIRGTKDSVRAKANELIKIFSNPLCPQSISIAAFAKKVVSHCETPDNAAFACGHVIVLVTSQVPHALDLLLAEFHKACIYTIPKHMVYIESAFESKEAYHKKIGYREDDGKIESVKGYLKRLESYIKLYAALVQTEVGGVQNTHGLKEGWAWLARFLNTLPANIYTAVALNAFLQIAGFALFRKYKSQFRKMLNIISENFLNALRAREDSELRPVIADIWSYIEDNKYLQEPEGRSLQDKSLSSVLVPELEYQEPYREPYRGPYRQQAYFY